jgi:hypothetical protein
MKNTYDGSLRSGHTKETISELEETSISHMEVQKSEKMKKSRIFKRCESIKK